MKRHWEVLQTEEEYDMMLERTIEIFHADGNSHEGKELNQLLVLLIDYEDRHFQISPTDPNKTV